MAKAKKKRGPVTKKSTQAEKDYAKEYYNKNKEALLAQKKQYRKDIKSGKHKAAQGTKTYKEKKRAQWRKAQKERYDKAQAAKKQEIIDNYNKLYGTGSSNR